MDHEINRCFSTSLPVGVGSLHSDPAVVAPSSSFRLVRDWVASVWLFLHVVEEVGVLQVVVRGIRANGESAPVELPIRETCGELDLVLVVQPAERRHVKLSSGS